MFCKEMMPAGLPRDMGLADLEANNWWARVKDDAGFLFLHFLFLPDVFNGLDLNALEPLPSRTETTD